jgi:hypothetical protein
MLLNIYCQVKVSRRSANWADPVGLRPLACWDGGFEAREGHICQSIVIVVCCHIGVFAMYRSFAQSGPIVCVCVCVCVRDQVLL